VVQQVDAGDEAEEDGRHSEANAELDLFNQANPDFEAPEIDPSQ
jgi:hypothetical protein